MAASRPWQQRPGWHEGPGLSNALTQAPAADAAFARAWHLLLGSGA